MRRNIYIACAICVLSINLLSCANESSPNTKIGSPDMEAPDVSDSASIEVPAGSPPPEDVPRPMAPSAVEDPTMPVTQTTDSPTAVKEQPKKPKKKATNQ